MLEELMKREELIRQVELKKRELKDKEITV
jgi:hypothetical protein